jgi:hypothetical protein
MHPRDFRLSSAGLSRYLRAVTNTRHGTSAGWHSGCRCTHCRRAHSDTQRAWGRARAHKRLPVEIRQQLLDAIYAGQPFRTVLRDLGLSSNKVFGLARTDDEWSQQLEAALTQAGEKTWSMARTPRTCTGVCAASVERISRFARVGPSLVRRQRRQVARISSVPPTRHCRRSRVGPRISRQLLRCRGLVHPSTFVRSTSLPKLQKATEREK